MNVNIILVLVGALLTILSGAALVFSELRAKESKVTRLELTAPTDDPAKDSRLYELKELLQHQQFISRLNGRADLSLIFGQYIIGALLASSFIQESVPDNVLGILGVLVLVSSLIRERYRPDTKAFAAKRRTVILRLLIRETEDSLYEINKGLENAPSVFSIRRRVTEYLSKIEESELADAQQEDITNEPA